MPSLAERRLAAKNKLASLARERKDAKLASEAKAKARLAADAKRKAKQDAKLDPAADSGGPALEATTRERLAEAVVKKRKCRRPKDKEAAKLRKQPLVPIVPIAVPEALGGDSYRKAHNVVCRNEEDCPEPFETFEAAEPYLGASFVQLLRDRGFLAPAPIQAQAWPLALGGRDVIAIAQTGSGKTLGYVLPALVRLRERGKPSSASEPAMPRVLVLAPTRELIQQIGTEVAKFAISIGHRFVPCFGGVWKNAQVSQLGKGCDILLSTPGRLKDFMLGDKAKGLAPAASVKNVAYLVLDEADAMLSMGFMPQITDIVRRCLKTGEPEQGGGAAGSLAGTARQTLFFTATWPRRVRAAAKEFTNNGAAQLRIGQGVGADKLTANRNVRQIVQVVEYWDKMDRLINVLTSELKEGDTCVIFCGTKGRTEYVVDELIRSEVVDWCEGIHSGKEQWVRDASLENFRWYTGASDRRAALVATDVAARGLDIPGVALVIVYDLNGWHGELNIDSYVHRIGRTGRAGKPGRAYTFVESKDRGLPELVRLLRDAGQRIPVPLRDVEVNERLPIAGVARCRRCPNGHELKPIGTTMDDGWACNGREEPGGCKSGTTDFGQTGGMDRFRCEECDYDLCKKCLKVDDNTAGSKSKRKSKGRASEDATGESAASGASGLTKKKKKDKKEDKSKVGGSSKRRRVE